MKKIRHIEAMVFTACFCICMGCASGDVQDLSADTGEIAVDSQMSISDVQTVESNKNEDAESNVSLETSEETTPEKIDVLSNYQKYDRTYSADTFTVRELDSLKGREDDFVMGADISLYSTILEAGGKYLNAEGEEESICKILADSGVNTVRIRLFNDYSSPYGTACGRLTEDRVIGMIKEAKQYDLKVILDLHYSDTWADPSNQKIPYAWKDMSYSETLNAFYDYTKGVLTDIKNENLSIDYIQIGNEIDYGIIKPQGDIDWNNQSESFDRLAEILSQGSKATREVFPDCKIIINTANGLYRWTYEDTWGSAELFYYQELVKRNLDFDIVGSSFYTMVDPTPISVISDIIDIYKKEINKPVMIVETSYAYTYEWNDYTANTFYTQDELSEYPVSFQGQTNFLLDIIDEVASAKSNNGLGVCYWGAEFIPNTDPDMKTSWANQALFTYEGVASPTLRVFSECFPQ